MTLCLWLSCGKIMKIQNAFEIFVYICVVLLQECRAGWQTLHNIQLPVSNQGRRLSPLVSQSILLLAIPQILTFQDFLIGLNL